MLAPHAARARLLAQQVWTDQVVAIREANDKELYLECRMQDKAPAILRSF